ncbi:TetR/AcrR family transcriptional regulator [Tunicatimonas pelagia]|uniref:TetR/AcrR family transcriptional regulator n=1 Tax=Tunicatimonas pelagia TaxID=931531 RepID=UPI002665E7A4|nr:TetR/AcrR family transcriptional regulator [Tunicatimonas pelagia]WKN43383.1 TetR/AcrR family transcriptional regulator [Tunicatimonas pelagia]
MGITERKERERREMRELILSTAINLFVEQGYESVSMRNIAEVMEYSPATIYLYFKDKNELLYALSEEGFRKFFAYFQSLPPQEDPLKRLQELGRIYIRFALENPVYYDLMFIMRSPMESHHTGESWDLGMESHGILTSVVKECIEYGYFQQKDPDTVAFMVWSFVHGLVSFKIRDRMKMYENQDHEEFIYDALALFNNMLGSL